MKLIAAIAALVALGTFGCANTSTMSPVASPRPVMMRAEAGTLWAAPNAWSEPRRAWDMPARGGVEDMKVTANPEGGYLVSFRQGGQIWRGELDAERNARGPLQPMMTPQEAVEALPANLATAQR